MVVLKLLMHSGSSEMSEFTALFFLQLQRYKLFIYRFLISRDPNLSKAFFQKLAFLHCGFMAGERMHSSLIPRHTFVLRVSSRMLMPTTFMRLDIISLGITKSSGRF